MSLTQFKKIQALYLGLDKKKIKNGEVRILFQSMNPLENRSPSRNFLNVCSTGLAFQKMEIVDVTKSLEQYHLKIIYEGSEYVAQNTILSNIKLGNTFPEGKK